MANESQYLQSFAIELKIDDSVKDVEADLKRFGQDLNDDINKSVIDAMKVYRTNQASLKQIDKQIQEYSKLQNKDAKKVIELLKKAKAEITGRTEEQEEAEDLALKQAKQKQEYKEATLAFVKKELAAGLNKALDKLKDILEKAWKELGNILNFSKLSNETTRNLRFSYGFSSAQAYGFTQAKNMLGLTSDEDLMYMNSQEKEQFLSAFNKYTEKYDRLYDQGFFTQLQEYQVEMAEFKQDVLLEFAQFFIENKDVLKTAMQGIIKMTEIVVSGLAWLVSKAGGPSIGTSSDIINNYGSKTVSVRVDNTFNGVARDNATQFENAIRDATLHLSNAL